MPRQKPSLFIKHCLNCRQDYDCNAQSSHCPYRTMSCPDRLKAQDPNGVRSKRPVESTPQGDASLKKLRTWQLWRDEEDGFEFLTWGRYRPTPFGSPTLVREFLSANWLTAQWEAFKERPPIDPNMRELVALLNEIPGVMTTGCCQGHPRRGHTFAYVGLHMDDLATLDQFVELLGKVLEGPAPLLVDLQLNWGKNFENSQEKVPAGALSFFMKLSRENRREQERAPRRSELAAFVQRLRLQARRAGLLSDPQQSDLERATLTAMRWWLDAKRSAR